MLWLSFAVLPGRLVRSSEFQHHNHSEASARIARQNEVRATATQALAGLILLFGGIYTARTYSLSKDAQFTDRLRSAVGQLSEGHVEAIGGVYALSRLAADSRRDRRDIVDVLAGYVRISAPLPAVPAPLTTERPVLDSVLQSALNAIGKRYTQDAPIRVLDLSRSALRGADLRDMVLPAVYMEGTDLASARLAGLSAEHADLSGASLAGVEATAVKLRGVLLVGSNLTKAIMTDADLRDARLRSAQLTGVFLGGAQMTNSELSRAHGSEALLPGVNLEDARAAQVKLPKAYLLEANLRRCTLYQAKLPGATLQLADLSGADMRGTDLRGADLRAASLREADCRDADFRNADLAGADLAGADLTGALLEGARLNGVRRDAADPPILIQPPPDPDPGTVAAEQGLMATSSGPTGLGPVRRALARLGVPAWRPDEAYLRTVARLLRDRREH